MDDSVLIEHMAKAGYERFFDSANWDEVGLFSIEGDLWREVAKEMLKIVDRFHGK